MDAFWGCMTSGPCDIGDEPKVIIVHHFRISFRKVIMKMERVSPDAVCRGTAWDCPSQALQQ
jgi:hypothetical protein